MVLLIRRWALLLKRSNSKLICQENEGHVRMICMDYECLVYGNIMHKVWEYFALDAFMAGFRRPKDMDKDSLDLRLGVLACDINFTGMTIYC